MDERGESSKKGFSMYRNAFFAGLIALAPVALCAPALAQTAPAAAKMSTASTTIGDLLDNAAAKVILDKHMPGFSTNPQVEMARGMTLRGVQPMVADQITVEMLDKIDADLATL
jgi:hypothetical protein